MHTLQLEHGITSFETWQAAFERDPARRQASGVRRYRVLSPSDDSLYVVVELDFDNLGDAQAFAESLLQIWNRVEQSPGLLREPGSARRPKQRILEERASHEYSKQR